MFYLAIISVDLCTRLPAECVIQHLGRSSAKSRQLILTRSRKKSARQLNKEKQLHRDRQREHSLFIVVCVISRDTVIKWKRAPNFSKMASGNRCNMLECSNAQMLEREQMNNAAAQYKINGTNKYMLQLTRYALHKKPCARERAKESEHERTN